MFFYTKNKEKVEYNLDIPLDEGCFGKIYLVEKDKCLKKFNEPIHRKDKKTFDEDIYNLIKGLKLSNIYVLHDLYYNKYLTMILGYLTKYYEKEDINILTMPVAYTLNNLCSLYESFKILSEHNIYTNDVHMGNIIVNSKSITIIDTDLFYKDDYVSSEKIFDFNISILGTMFVELYISCINSKDKYERIRLAEKILKLFLMNSEYGVEPVIKKLCKYKYPIDYLRKK